MAKQNRERQKCRLFAIDLYPENEKHCEILENLAQNYNMVYILHDRDVYTEDCEIDGVEHKAGEKKKAHYHVIVKFINARYLGAFADEIGIEHNLVAKCSSFTGYCVYQTHTEYPNKAQYSPAEFHGSLADEARRVQNPPDVSSVYLTISSFISCYDGYLEYDTLCDYIFKCGYIGYFMRNSYCYDQLRIVHNKRFYENERKR